MTTTHRLTDRDIRAELANLAETFTTQAADLLRQLDSPYISAQTREAHLDALATTLDKAITAAYNDRDPRDDQDFPTSIYQ